MQWFSIRVLFQYDVLDAPVAEFVDDGFVENWRAFEQSLFLVRAATLEAAAERVRSAEEHEAFVNVYGQRVRRALVQVLDDYRVAELDGARDLGDVRAPPRGA